MKTSVNTAILLNVAALVAAAPAPTAEDLGSISARLDLEDRAGNYGISGMRYCGIFANADGPNTASILSSLSGDMKNDEYTVAAHGCYRVACHNTSGVYVCNDNDSELTVNGGDVAYAAVAIDKHCCYMAGGTKRGISSGQQFTQWGWNVVLGYADCNAGATQRPSDAGGFGVNPGTCEADTAMTNANSD